MVRYGRHFQNKVVARLLPPERAKLSAASLEVGVFRSDAGALAELRTGRAGA